MARNEKPPRYSAATMSCEPTWMTRVMEELHVQFDPCPEGAGG